MRDWERKNHRMIISLSLFLQENETKRTKEKWRIERSLATKKRDR